VNIDLVLAEGCCAMSDSADARGVLSRRALLGSGAASALSAAAYREVKGANDRIGLGCIGFGLIGKRHVLDFRQVPGARIVAVAEVHRGRRVEAVALAGGSARAYADFRALLDDNAVSAVVISTPDHWHALMTMMACAAGKDVYVEKPLTLFPREGQWMLDVARRHNRVVQVGTQQRSGPHYQRARELVKGGHIGQVVAVRMWNYRNVMPGFGSPPDSDPPPELDYDMWLGPAPKRPYNANRSLYHFRWFWDYSGGQMTNLGQHSLDIVDWFLGGTAPMAVTSAGGRHALKDNGETPDSQDSLFEYPGWTATWSQRECSRGAAPAMGLEFCGTRGSLKVSRKGFLLTLDPKVTPEEVIPRFGAAHPPGGPATTGRRETVSTPAQTVEDRTGDEFDQFRRHAANFLECIRSRHEPISDLVSGHRVATACHLANLSLRLGRKLRWDSARETVLGDSEAEARLERPYRAPWNAERDALIRGS
jgi:predicted dehydrogenase